MLKILNLGCGQNPIPCTNQIEYTNVDLIKPKLNDKIIYVKHNLLKFPYPFEPHSFDKILMSHTIEHIPKDRHANLLIHIRGLLKLTGQIAISYPEFKECARRYAENIDGREDFWEWCIYGRGNTEWDRHKALMDTPKFMRFLNMVGLTPVKAYSEKREPYNSVVICNYGEPMMTAEDVFKKEMNL